jgi:hypothetical protein
MNPIQYDGANKLSWKLLFSRITLRIAGIVFMLASVSSNISWLMFLGIVFLAISFFISPVRQIDKIPSTKQFITYSTLFTVGIILMLLGISWLTFIGATVVLLSSFFSSRWPASFRIFLPLFIFLGGAVVDFIWSIRDGDIFSRTPPPLWFFALLIGALLWGVISEYRSWQRGRSSTHSY